MNKLNYLFSDICKIFICKFWQDKFPGTSLNSNPPIACHCLQWAAGYTKWNLLPLHSVALLHIQLLHIVLHCAVCSLHCFTGLIAVALLYTTACNVLSLLQHNMQYTLCCTLHYISNDASEFCTTFQRTVLHFAFETTLHSALDCALQYTLYCSKLCIAVHFDKVTLYFEPHLKRLFYTLHLKRLCTTLHLKRLHWRHSELVCLSVRGSAAVWPSVISCNNLAGKRPNSRLWTKETK